MQGPSSPPFVVPLNLRELEIPPDDGENRLFAQKVTDIDALQPDEVEQLVKGLAFDLADKEVLCIEEQEIFDQVYSLVRGFSSLEPGMKGSLIESLSSNFSVLLPNITSLLKSAQESSNDSSSLGNHIHSHRNAFRIYCYFIQSIAFTEAAGTDTEKERPIARATAKSKQSRKKHLPKPWDWELQRARIVRLLAAAVDEDLKQLFGSSQPEETLLAYILKGVFSLLEDPAVIKDKDVKDALYNLIASCSTKYHYITQSAASILHLLHKHEHLPVCLAEAVAHADQKYHDSSLAVALVREIGRLNPKEYARDGLGADNIGKFLVELAERLPKVVTTNVGILMPHFGGESYKIRSALVSVFGKLISKMSKEFAGNGLSETNRLRSKQAMIDVLIERSRDTAAYTRSRVLQTWAELCEDQAVSIGLWNQVADVAAGRLEDKAAIVRKSALQLLSTLLKYNPFGPQLRTAAFEATLSKYKGQLESMSSQSQAEGPNKGGDEVNEHSDLLIGKENSELNISEVAEEVVSEGLVGEDSGPSQNPEQVHQPMQTSDVGGLEQTRALVASLEAGLRFTKCVASTMPVLVQLLASSNGSDVEHTIQLLMCARQFNVDGAEPCLRKMLPLIFSQEKAIHDAVENAFYMIYVKKNSFETAMNLINLTMDSCIGDLTSMERILYTLVKKGEISQNMIMALWDFFTFNAPGATAEQSRGALVVLSMLAKASPKILNSHMQNIIDIGFGRWAREDMMLARTACDILQQLSEDDRSTVLTSHKIFNHLENVIMMSALPEESWYATAEQAVNAIYMLHPQPETFAATLLKKFYTSTFTIDKEPGSKLSDSCCTDYQISVTSLSRFLFLVGHIALKHFVYIESCVRKARKFRNDKEREAMENQSGPHGKETKEENINAELGVAASVDARIDTLQERAEKDILSVDQSRKFLIGSCAPLVAKIARNFSLMQEFPVLQSSAMLALCKLMVLDADFCEENLQLLFTVAQNASEDTVRSNCIIALGDLTVRFPNLLEPWTEHVYARLRDCAQSVRKNAVLVLSHLILNDMMKVKGHITEMTLCLEDKDSSISNSVKLFFHELSKKGNNPIYNLLPDILSRLSGVKDLEQETFNNIMQFLIGSIKKDKQMEGLIEKLCHRFLGTTDSKQWQNIAYCLSQLTYSDKGIRKLVELFKSYQHTLALDEVVNHFKTIISKAKKFAKAEVKATIDEFEKKILEFHEERKEQETTMRSAQSHFEAQMQTEEILASTEILTMDTPSSSSLSNGSVVQDHSENTMAMVSSSLSEGCTSDSIALGHEDLIRNDFQEQVTSEGNSEVTSTNISPQISVGMGSRMKIKSEEDTLEDRRRPRIRVKTEGVITTMERQSSATGIGSTSLFDEEISSDKEGDKENEEDNSHLPTFAGGKRIVKREEETKVSQPMLRPRRGSVLHK